MAGCFHCGNSFPDDFKIYRSTTCPSCGKDAKVCLNCRFYSPGSHWDCRETISEAVRDKDRANFCDYFSIKPSAGGSGSGVQKADKARSQFDSLFGNDE